MSTKKTTRAGGSLNNSRADSITSKKPGKLISMFARFANAEKIHRFQAEKLGDHCLETAVAGLQTKHSIYFSRVWTTVPNRFGSESRVKSYFLAGKDLTKARSILGWREAA